MHTRDYSEDTSKVIDDEVERILRSEEQRAMEALSKHRGGLNAIARALLDNEIIDGAEVARLVDEAHGSPVHGEGVKSVPHFSAAAIRAPAATVTNGSNGAGDEVTGGTNGHATVDETGVQDDGPVVSVPVTPSAPATGLPSDAEAWPPPPWPPSDPAAGAPEGSTGG
jgi:hypothetical protein